MQNVAGRTRVNAARPRRAGDTSRKWAFMNLCALAVFAGALPTVIWGYLLLARERILASPTLARTDDWDRGSFKTDSSHNPCKKRRESHCTKHRLLAQADMRSIDAYLSGG